MMAALEDASTAIAGTDANTVLLINAAGKQLMTLKKLPIDTNTRNNDDD